MIHRQVVVVLIERLVDEGCPFFERKRNRSPGYMMKAPPCLLKEKEKREKEREGEKKLQLL